MMRHFQRKKGWRVFLESWPVVGILLFMVLFFAWGVIGLLHKMEVTRQNKKNAEVRVAELELQKEQLTADIDKLNTPEGKEASIREKFGLAKEGEREIVIVEDPEAEAAKEESSSGFFSFFVNLFK
jgi:hypothetical protein